MTQERPRRPILTLTGRTPRDPEMQDLRTRTLPRRGVTEPATDYTEIEIRALAAMDAKGQAADRAFSFDRPLKDQIKDLFGAPSK